MKAVVSIVIAVVVALVAVLSLPPGWAVAAPDRLRIDSLTLDVGQEGPTLLRASEIAQPGVGAWRLDISYDSSVVEVVDCVGMEGTVCLTEFGPQTIRISGASAVGLEPEAILAQFVFRCQREGVSGLSIHINIWDGLTVAVPQPPRDVDIEDGTITCVLPALDTPTAPATPGPTPPAVLPSTGGTDGPSNRPVVAIAALIAVAAMALLSAAALRARG